MPAARIRYDDDQPYSLDYGDIYHAADGAAEVQRVFVEPCALPTLAAVRARRPGAAATVRIGELGFGSGLNFVIAAQTCLAAGAHLHFVSVEARPLDAADFRAIAAHRSGDHPLYRELADRYPPRLHGWHQRLLAGGRVRLNVWLGDARDALADLHGRQRQPFDAWFLDGFAPDRNPDMWNDELFSALAALSARGTRVATFTAAGRVRRGLESVGFAMARVDQRPHKRESLAGTFVAAAPSRSTAPAPPARVRVAGGGLAGASAAWHLAQAGCAVVVYEPGGHDRTDRQPTLPCDDAIPLPGSRMPATVLHARLLADGSATAALRCHAYHYAAALVRGLPGFTPGGALQIAADPDDEPRLQRLAELYRHSGTWLEWLPQAAASERAGWPLAAGALWLADAGVVELPVLVGALLDHPNVTVVPERLDVLPADEPVILACGAGVRDFPEAGYLEVAPVHGQLDVVELPAAPRLALVGSHYLVPFGLGVAAGSTYEHRPWPPETASAANLAQLGATAFTWLYRCRGTRSVSSDRTAIAGPLFAADGAPLGWRYVSTGHGSAGNVSAHLAGAVIAAQILGDCPPLARPADAALSPWRFRERQARRGIRHGDR
ncbi:MAG: tRNA (5-methylaminomethyl-2-thiouridine)(34)-methyltransferase MnmD [Pseudomonadales bacterium]